jgi:hypothetical protein
MFLSIGSSNLSEFEEHTGPSSPNIFKGQAKTMAAKTQCNLQFVEVTITVTFELTTVV